MGGAKPDNFARTRNIGPETDARSRIDPGPLGHRVLLVDDNPETSRVLRRELALRGLHVEVATTRDDAMTRIVAGDLDAVVTDIGIDAVDGLDLCHDIARHHALLPVVAIVGAADRNTAIEAISAGGCDDLFHRPVSPDALALSLLRAIQHRTIERDVAELARGPTQSVPEHGLLGRSPAMAGLLELIDRAACTEATVLLEGESGTGKELAARAIHEASERARGPFVPVHCAAIPETLFESELFGHARGSFTGARSNHTGLLKRANGGTLLLDEVGEIPLNLQPKLLRVLASRRTRPVGGNADVELNLRVVAATNRNLSQDVKRGLFRQDLYYRLDVMHIELPPLRERGKDILLLAQAFLERAAHTIGKPVRGLRATTAEKLMGYDWPGNVRELANVIERAVVFARFDQLTPEDLPPAIRERRRDPIRFGNDPQRLPTLQEAQRQYIEHVLALTNGHRSRAARVLGINRQALYRRLRRLGLE